MGFGINKKTNPAKITEFTYQGKLVTLEMLQGQPKTLKHWRKGVYHPVERTHAAVIYAVTGDAKQAAAIAKIPEREIKKWRVEPWFQNVLAEVRDENKHLIDAKLSSILEKSLEKLEERIEDGDVSFNYRTGEQVVIPVKAKELAGISTAIHKQRALDRGEPTSITASAGMSTEAKLEKLAEAFSSLADKKKQQRVFENQKIEDAEIIKEIPKNEISSTQE